MNCQEALELLYDIIDKEASDIDAKEVQEHLDRCRQCSEIYRIESSIQALIDERLKNEIASPRLDALKSKVLLELDSIDSEMTKGAVERPSFFRLSRMVALAASLMLVITAVWWIYGFDRQDIAYSPLAQAHISAINELDFYKDDSHTLSSVAMVQNDLHYNLDASPSGFQLTGGQVKELLGTQTAHFVFQNGEKVVSVFILDSESYKIPEDLQTTEVTIGDITFYDYKCHDCRLVYHCMGDAAIICACTSTDVDLLRFVPGSRAV